MTLLPAWAVQGGSAAPEVARAMAFAATGGAYGGGVVEWPDLKVTANGTSSVQIAPGVAVIPTRYASSVSQATYVVANDAQVELEIPATGSGAGATQYLILLIDDPQYGGPVPPDPATAPYSRFALIGGISNVSVPFVPLAKIVQPPSTTNITTAMIESIRKVSQPRSDIADFAIKITSTVTVSGTGFETVKESGDIWIPEWATRGKMLATWSGVRIPALDVDGDWATTFAGVAADSYVRVNEEGQAGHHRVTYATSGSFSIPENKRGTFDKIAFRARKTAGGSFIFDGGVNLSGALYFREEPA